MQTTLLGLAIAFIIALIAALVGPYFIDWNQFRPQFEAEATRIVGTPVRVAGKLDARLLPAPMEQSFALPEPIDARFARLRIGSVYGDTSDLVLGEWKVIGRPGLPEDVGPVIAALLSDEFGWVNAQRIEVAGGMQI